MTDFVVTAVRSPDASDDAVRRRLYLAHKLVLDVGRLYTARGADPEEACGEMAANSPLAKAEDSASQEGLDCGHPQS